MIRLGGVQMSRKGKIYLASAMLALVAACSEGGGTFSGLDGPENIVDTSAATQSSRFLRIATMGPNQVEIDALTDHGYSNWFRAQLASPIVSVTELISDLSEIEEDEPFNAWWVLALRGENQLHQRFAYALSQIIVVNIGEVSDGGFHAIQLGYIDILQNALNGTYRDLLEEITYSPAMAQWLTYLGSRKANPENGAVPDQNYAREILQLFSIGLVDLNRDGTPVLDNTNEPIESYTQDDIVGLAEVFTGLWWADTQYGRRSDVRDNPDIQLARLQMNEEQHSDEDKNFLGCSIPGSTPGDEAISQALDCIEGHPNTAPFISRQLIQRFVTANPDPAYVARVVDAWEAGSFTLPDGRTVGDGRRGHLQAVLAAVLLDPVVIGNNQLADPTFGKIREPALRITHWARAFELHSIGEVADWSPIRNMGRGSDVRQKPLHSPSVFNFYRPGYVPPGTQISASSLVSPEMQIIDAATVLGYQNKMDRLIRHSRNSDDNDGEFAPDYSAFMDVVDDVEAMADRLNILLLGGRMTSETRARMVAAINGTSSDDVDEEKLYRIHAAVYIAVTSPEYMITQ